MTRQIRMLLLMALDVLLVNAATVSAVLLVSKASLLSDQARIGAFALVTAATSLSSFYFFGLYNRIWEYAGAKELYAIIKAVTLTGFLQFCLNLILFKAYLPGSVFLISWLLMLFFVGGSRFCWRLMRDLDNFRLLRQRKKPVLIVGAGGAGALVARAIQENETDLAPVGFVDDSDLKQNMKMYGLPVLGKREDIPALVERHAIEEIIIAIPSASSRELRELVNISSNTPARLKITPSVFSYIRGNINLKQIRDVEVEDLLRREPVRVNLQDIAGYLNGRVVLVTGAGGSVGSELCIQAASFRPRLLVLLGRGENSLYEASLALESRYPGVNREIAIADVRDRYRIEQIFSQYRPDVVFHAAAHKHVPLMEKNPYEAFVNNVIGTLNVARAAKAVQTGVFILISTDKAVKPKSVMGATKRAAEMIIQEFNRNSDTRYSAVRFGNVLGSRGSVVPLFKKQIARGGPVTVTDPDMVRYFMTVSEAAQLVIQAGALAKGGEIFLLDMGEPVRIVDLARDLIKLSGFRPDLDIPIVYTGVRPGEKLFEELFTENERVDKTAHERILVSRSEETSSPAVKELIEYVDSPGFSLNDFEALELLRNLIPEFGHADSLTLVEGK
ncbi:MAG TPA: nucleoside-diphosphate sugar epimerase/dehydratase [Bacillota bacterium]|jgi:FlaA1/EpsC-like NDP-sugar epimerase|nr:polysaccharide biosynthesis protein [Peptococcaceae bacterium]HPZ43330.1 nucleoside-diphosphate sugar epimerase/dehydratase [Bacillota bacterium]HQD75948.1 nucleoside-diphosphate sugar epimerase/dehydratase [Bacillota bacterium]HUM58611.1 nucleoside-diphosphate sugar epimerase/dehydratase [Bacillota bacterium]